MSKIIEKLHDLKSKLNSLKETDYRTGNEEYYSINQLLERIIDRTYPEKDAGYLKSELNVSFPVSNITDSQRNQRQYEICIGTTIRVINTIIDEYELFGFEDFEPMKEKTETEYQVGSERFGALYRKKKTK